MSNSIVIPASGTVNIIAWSEFCEQQVFAFIGQQEWRRPVVGLVFNPFHNPRDPLATDKDGDFLSTELLVVAEHGSVYRMTDYLYSLMRGDHWEHSTHFYEPHVPGPVTSAPQFRRINPIEIPGRCSLMYLTLEHLPFKRIVACDFEYLDRDNGDPVEPTCGVFHELLSNEEVRLWADEFGSEPPFPVDDDTLWVAYAASAEMRCFHRLGWTAPTRILDLYAEFRSLTNNQTLAHGSGLLGALQFFHLPAMTTGQKEADRALAMRGGPYTDEEKQRLLDYCAQDVTVLAPLLSRMLPLIGDEIGLGRALLRGRYAPAIAAIEETGCPLDTEVLGRLRTLWPQIKLRLIEEVDVDYGVYTDGSFRDGLFSAYLEKHEIPWPRTETGRLKSDDKTFRAMAASFPQLAPLRELRVTLSDLKTAKLACGADGRNRVNYKAFTTRSGRNAPSNSNSIFGPSRWVRSLIKPAPGRGIAYMDYKSQEVYIQAALSGDRALVESLETGDVYMDFARRSGLCPPDATKSSHPEVRDLCKVLLLGTSYGMGPWSLAMKAKISEIEAESLLYRHSKTYPVFTDWVDNLISDAKLRGRMETVFGWGYAVTDTADRPVPGMAMVSSNSVNRQIRNYPCQANAAEMLRLAICRIHEAGIQIDAAIHDAVMVEADLEELDETIARVDHEMRAASRDVLGDLEVPVDIKVVRYPDRYVDDRPGSAEMWARVMRLLDEAEAVTV